MSANINLKYFILVKKYLFRFNINVVHICCRVTSGWTPYKLAGNLFISIEYAVSITRWLRWNDMMAMTANPRIQTAISQRIKAPLNPYLRFEHINWSASTWAIYSGRHLCHISNISINLPRLSTTTIFTHQHKCVLSNRHRPRPLRNEPVNHYGLFRINGHVVFFTQRSVSARLNRPIYI